jgi:hypothetical protein
MSQYIVSRICPKYNKNEWFFTLWASLIGKRFSQYTGFSQPGNEKSPPQKEVGFYESNSITALLT